MNMTVGIKIGAVVGILLWFTADFMLYGISNVANLMSTVIDPAAGRRPVQSLGAYGQS